MLLAPALLLLGQVVAPLSGTAVDGEGRPLVGLEIILARGQAPDGTVPVLDRSITDSRGRYTISASAAGRGSMGSASPTLYAYLATPTLYAYRPGSGLVGFVTLLRRGDPEQSRLAVQFPEAGRRTLTVRDGAGRPLAGVRLAPLLVRRLQPGQQHMLVPDALADLMEATTGPDGRAELACLDPTTELVCLRATIPGLGTHALALPAGEFRSELVTLDLKRSVAMTGRIRERDGKPASGAQIEVWSQASYNSVLPVRFEAGAVRSGADGTFRTPSTLLAGVKYRALIRAPGFKPFLTPWVASSAAAADALTVLPAVLLTPVRDVDGRVIDRQGRFVAGAKVVAAGESASATTDAMGKFRLVGLPSSRTLLVVRHDGFRITGRLLDGRSNDVELVLARFDEPAIQPLTTLESPIPLEERRRLARRILEPYLVKALARGDDLARSMALHSLMTFDPKAALEALERTKFDQVDRYPSTVRLALARELVGAAPEQAVAVASSVPGARLRARTLVDVGVALPDDQRPRKRAVAERVLQLVPAEPEAQRKLTLLGDAGELLLDAGAVEQARTVFAEGQVIAGKLGAESRQAVGHFAARLARVDLAAAVAMLGGFDQAASHPVAFGNLATRIAASNPVEAERVAEAIRGEPRSWALAPRICAKMAPVDLARARRIALGQPSPIVRAMALVFAASGLPAGRRESARELVREAVRELDQDRDVPESTQLSPAALMPQVEAIDPALVPEFFWRAVADIGVADDPRSLLGRDGVFRDAILLARYDREVALALSEPAAKATIVKGTDDAEMSPLELTILALIAPQRAVAAVEAMPDRPDLARSGADRLRCILSQLLGNDDDASWRRLWSDYSDLHNVLNTRDVPDVR